MSGGPSVLHFIRLAALLLLFTALSARAATAVPMPNAPAEDQAAFDRANRYLGEQSMTRACDAFREFLRQRPSSELAREAQVKGARACLQAGKDGSDSLQTLRKLAEDGPVDLPRALAHLTLAEQGEYWIAKGNKDRNVVALEQLEAVARDSGGRWAKEAKAHFFRMAFARMEQQSWETATVEKLCERVLALEPSATERARARYLRALSWRQTGGKERLQRMEKELLEIGGGQTEFADDALYTLAEQKESLNQFTAALELYGQITSRFSGTTSNVKDRAQSRAEEIRRPQLGLSTQYIELPGTRPSVRISFRNVKEVTLTLRRADPLQQDARALHDNWPLGAPGAEVKRWTRKLSEPGPHVPGTLEEPLDLKGPGAWSVEVTDGKQTSKDWLLVTPLAMALKIAPTEVAVFVTDAVTGEAAKNAEVAVFANSYDNNYHHTRVQGRTDENGLARIPLKSPGRLQGVTAWASAGDALTFARGSPNGYSSEEQREWLAYVMTDRTLYKPGETVGAKLFLRSRANGPSSPVANRTVRVRVYDPQSREALVKELTTNDFGTAAFQLPLGKDATLGQWRAHVENVGDGYLSLQQAASTFRVEEFKPPEFQVKVEPVGSPEIGKPVKVRITASRYSGGPVANANGRAIVSEQGYLHNWGRWEDDPASEPDYGYDDYEYGGYPGRGYGRRWQPTYRQTTLTFKTGPDGSTELELPKPDNAEDRSYTVQVFVTDASRREVTGSGTINVSSRPFFVDVRTDRYLYKPGEPIKLKLRSEDANGRPQSPLVSLRLARLDKEGNTSTILERTAQLKDGRAEATLDGDAVGPVRLEVRVPNDQTIYAITDVWLTSDVKPLVPPQAGFQLLTDRAPLAVGGTVRALAVTPNPNGHVLFTIEGQGLHAARALPLNGRARFVELPLNVAMTPNAWLMIGRFEQGSFLQHQAMVRVKGTDNALQVNVSHSSEVVEPGAEQKARIDVKGAKGEVELAVSSVDEAIFAIEPDRDDLLTFFGRRHQQLWVGTANTQSYRAFRPVQHPTKKPDEPVTQTQPVEPKPSDDAPAPASPAPAMEAAAGLADEESSKEKRMEAPAGRAAGAPSPAKASAGPGGSAEPPVKVRSNFSSSAGWFPQVRTSRNTALALQVPDSLTRFRTRVVAMTTGEQMGTGKASFRTEKPLMVRLQAPRFFTERDEVTLSGLVSSRLPRAASVRVSFTAPGFEPL
ncbi:MAG TPA: MG2 domain-containing protein, partial [Myxococcaceae bacterium]